MPFAPLSGESDNLPFAPLRPQAMQPLPRPCKQRKMASFTQPRLARCDRMLQPAADRGRSAAAVAADGGRADGKGRDAAHGCQRCRQRLRLHVEINPNRVDSALSLSQCCLAEYLPVLVGSAPADCRVRLRSAVHCETGPAGRRTASNERGTGRVINDSFSS